MQFTNVIQRAGEAITQSELGRAPHVLEAWRTMQWRELPHAGEDAAVNEKDLGTVNLFSGLSRKQGDDQVAAVVREFGLSLYRRYATAEVKQRWEHKLVLPQASQIDAVQAKLADPQYDTYKAIMESFKSLMDRYVSLNLTNALLANNVSRTGALNVDLKRWGSTLEYANIRRVHSLKPFVYAYGPRGTAECPGCGLAELVVYRMKHITESSLAEAFTRLIQGVYFASKAA